MEKTLTIKNAYGSFKMSDIDDEGDIEVLIEDGKGGAKNMYLNRADLFALGKHLMYLGQKIALKV